MVLAVYKAAIIWKENGAFSGLSLVKVLIQDQISYFIVYVSCPLNFSVVLMIYETRLMFCTVANVVAFGAELSQLLQNIFNVLGNPTLLCIMGSHLLIHLREAAEKGRNEGTSYRSKPHSAIDFWQGEESSDLGKLRQISHCCFSTGA